jgi:hypothetical protein
LADIQPDVDAIFRLTHKTPFVFKKGSSKAILKIPQNIVTPYNAQATLHFYDAFWALYLPVTVAGRVSDIWRSYFTQSLFSSLGLSIGFLPRLYIRLALVIPINVRIQQFGIGLQTKIEVRI